jgi:hypothetical protein
LKTGITTESSMLLASELGIYSDWFPSKTEESGIIEPVPLPSERVLA